MEDTKKDYPHSAGARENAYDRAIKAENALENAYDRAIKAENIVTAVRAEMGALRIQNSRLQVTIIHLMDTSKLIPIDDQQNHILDILSLRSNSEE